MGIGRHLLELYGDDVAKIKLEAPEEPAGWPKAKYVVIFAGLTEMPCDQNLGSSPDPP